MHFWTSNNTACYLLCTEYFVLNSTRVLWPVLDYCAVLSRTAPMGTLQWLRAQGSQAEGNAYRAFLKRASAEEKGFGLGKGHTDPNHVATRSVYTWCMLCRRGQYSPRVTAALSGIRRTISASPAVMRHLVSQGMNNAVWRIHSTHKTVNFAAQPYCFALTHIKAIV